MKQVCPDGKYCFVKFGPPNAPTVSRIPEIQASCVPEERCNHLVEDALSISTWTQAYCGPRSIWGDGNWPKTYKKDVFKKFRIKCMKQVCPDGHYCFVKFGPPNAPTVSRIPEMQAMCIPKESCNYWVEDALSISTWTQAYCGPRSIWGDGNWPKTYKKDVFKKFRE